MDATKHVAKNLKFILASELILAALKFASRRVFVFTLGKAYLGLNGLFSDILSALSLAELGFGVSITYSLYRPVAQGDTELIKSLVRLYRRVYRTVGAAVLAAGLALSPFLNFFVKEMPGDIPSIPLIYALTVVNTGISYFWSYKSTLLFVYQKKYIDATVRTVVALFATGAQITVLLLTHNYVYYLYIAIVATLVQNMVVSAQTDRLYPFLREREARPLPAEVLGDIRRNVGAMILHRIGSVAVFSTDNLLISKFVGIETTGLYSNYMMLRGLLNIAVNALSNAVMPALGNLTVTSTVQEKRTAFRRLNFCAAWLFGWMSICLLCLYDPFIELWLGAGYLLPSGTVLLIVVNFYITSMRIPVANSKSVMGLFWDERYKSIFEALVNLGVSIVLARRWGIAGVLTGTLISTMSMPFWIEPLGLFRYGLKQAPGEYFSCYFFHLAVASAAGGLTKLLCGITETNILGFLWKALLCAVVPNMVCLVVYWRMPEMRFLKELFTRMGTDRKKRGPCG